MLERSVKKRGATVGADKGYDTEAFVGTLERLGLRAHVARKSRARAAAVPLMDARRAARATR